MRDDGKEADVYVAVGGVDDGIVGNKVVGAGVKKAGVHLAGGGVPSGYAAEAACAGGGNVFDRGVAEDINGVHGNVVAGILGVGLR